MSSLPLHYVAPKNCRIDFPQPSPRHPLLWWGMNSTLFGKYPLDQHPEPHGTSSSTLNACESMCVNPIGYIGPTRSASFPTEVNDVLTWFASRITKFKIQTP